MIEQGRCPDPGRWRQLLDGSLADEEKSILSAHLEACPGCQRTLEELAADSAAWSRAARHLAGARADGTALRRLLADVGAEAVPSATRAEPDPGAGPALDFLGPPRQPGELGRLGHYAVREVLGRGGMGVVLKAFDEALQRVVAIKVMAPQLATSAAARQRFAREARAAAAVRDEHVIDIHAVEEANGLPYLVMEYVAGVSLQERLDRTGPLEPKEVLRIGAQVAAGLAAAHAHGLVHRDVKPANILLENGVERVKITDFGLARAVDDASLTQSGVVAGTPQYMAPEQARAEAVDHRADLFSLGSVLYALCTGRPPFRAGGSMAVLRCVCEDTPRPIRESNPEVPDWLVEIVGRLHAKDPAGRYQSAAEVAELLSGQLAHLQHPSIVPPAPPPAVGPPNTRRRRWAMAAAALLCLAAGLGLTEATGVTRFTPAMIRILTPDGTLVVAVDGPDVHVTIAGDGGPVLTGAGPQEVRLRPGSYRVQADRDGRRVPLERELVRIVTGGREIVRVKPEAPPAQAAAKAAQGPFVLLAGGEERRFDTLAEAVLAVSDGATVEVRGNGPYTVEPIEMGDRPLTLRAGQGYRPTLALDSPKADALLKTNAALVLEGIEFVRRSEDDALDAKPPFKNIIRAYGGVLHVANCRFVRKMRGPGFCVSSEGTTRAEFRNSVFLHLGPGGYHGILFICPPAGALVVENSVDAGWYGGLNLLMDHPSLQHVSVALRQNTWAGGNVLFVSHNTDLLNPPNPGAPRQPGLSVEAAQDVFDCRGTFLRYQPTGPGAAAPPQPWAEAVRSTAAWRDEGSLYPATISLRAGTEPAPPPAVEGIAAWDRLWDLRPPGSLSGRPAFQGGDVYTIARTGGEHLKPDDFRLRPDSPGYRAGKGGKDLGADIDLVGPGPAYERWKKTPEYGQWLKDTGQVK
jgi:anti-sigma factor RsiW